MTVTAKNNVINMDAWALDIPQLRADNRPSDSWRDKSPEAGDSDSSLESSSSQPETVGGTGTGPGSGRDVQPEDYYSGSDLATGSTVPVGDEGLADSLPAEKKAVKISSSSHSSTSSSSSSEHRSFGSTSLYQPEFLTPVINYDRDNEQQKLIAIIGREFDRPSDIVSSLQKWIPKQPKSEIPVAKFVPFTPRRKMLLKGNFDSQELKKHDLICMCYNASEARILLTGPDGFYTSLLRHVEALLGISFQRGSRLVLGIHVDRGSLSTNHELASQTLSSNADCWAAVFIDVCPEEDCSLAVETSAFDDEFVKPIRGW